MNILQDIQKLAVKKVPVIQPGNTVKVHQKIKEGEKERIQIFEGLVLKLNSGYGADKTFTVRRIVGGIGVERIFPLYSTNIVKIEVKKKSKVRRAKLYYMRKRSGKSARLKETFVSDKELEESVEELAEQQVDEQNVAETETEVQTEAEVSEDKAEVQTETPPAKEAEASEDKAEAPEDKPEDTPADAPEDKPEDAPVKDPAEGGAEEAEKKE